MSLNIVSKVFPSVAVVLLCASCADLDQPRNASNKALTDRMKTAMAAPEPEPAYWHAEAGEGPPKIVVNLGLQRAYFFRGKKVIGESNISTGRKGFETPPGRYRVIQKDENHVSNLYGSYVADDGSVVKSNAEVGKDPLPAGAQFVGAPMPNFLRFTGGYGMHAGFVPRYRASHGCIRMPREMSAHFFEAAELDTPVIVTE